MYRGRINLTYEMLSETLGVDKDINIENIYIDSNNQRTRTITVVFNSENKSEVTPEEFKEGMVIPLVSL